MARKLLFHPVMIFKKLLIALVILSVPTAFAAGTNTPDIGEVQRVALEYARIQPEEITSFKKRTRVAAALPQFQIGARRVFQNNIDIAINENVSVTSSGSTVGPETSDVKQTSDDNLSLEVKAIWSLSDLIYNRDMLDVTEAARVQARDRRMILSEVNALYFEWLEIVNGVKRPADPRLPPPSPYRKDQIIADLDALTGGWFSKNIAD